MATTKRLSATLTIGGAISSSLKSTFGTINKSISGVGKSVTTLESKQRLLGRSIRDLGKAGLNIDGLRSKYASVTAELERARRAQERFNKSQAAAKKIGGLVSSASLAIGAGVAAGGLMARPLIGSAIDRENHVLAIRNSGISKEDADAAVKFATGIKQFGVSSTKALDTFSELRTALGDTHHAMEALPTTLKAISGLQLYDRLHGTDLAGGDSSYSLAKIADERGGANDPEALREKQNWAFKTITGTNGKVSANDILTAVRSGKGAVQAMSDEAFFGDTFLLQAMGADRYGTSNSTLVNAWIGGHQKNTAFEHMNELGLLREFDANGKRLFGRDKNGNVNKVSPDALVDAQTFLKDPQKWVDQHLVPLAKQKGVDTNDPAAVMAFVNAITSNPNAANLLLSRIRFSQNIAKDRRNVLQANGIDASDQANRESTAGKVDNARARLDDAESRMGTVLLPAFASAMEKAATALEAVNKFAETSPTAFKAMTVGIVGLTTVVGGLSAVSLTSKLAIGGASTLVGGLGSAIGALASPIGIAVAAIGVLAAAIYAFRPISQKEVDSAKDQGGAKLTPTAQARVNAGEVNRLGPAPVDAPDARKLPPVVAARSAAQSNTTNVHVGGITVNAAPGQSVQEIGKEVIRQLNNQTAVKSRSVLFDGAAQ
jgi:hypothetical protein